MRGLGPSGLLAIVLLIGQFAASQPKPDLQTFFQQDIGLTQD